MKPNEKFQEAVKLASDGQLPWGLYQQLQKPLYQPALKEKKYYSQKEVMNYFGWDPDTLCSKIRYGFVTKTAPQTFRGEEVYHLASSLLLVDLAYELEHYGKKLTSIVNTHSHDWEKKGVWHKGFKSKNFVHFSLANELLKKFPSISCKDAHEIFCKRLCVIDWRSFMFGLENTHKIMNPEIHEYFFKEKTDLTFPYVHLKYKYIDLWDFSTFMRIVIEMHELFKENLTEDEAAEYTGETRTMINALIRRGHIQPLQIFGCKRPHHKTNTVKHIILKDDLRDFISTKSIVSLYQIKLCFQAKGLPHHTKSIMKCIDFFKFKLRVSIGGGVKGLFEEEVKLLIEKASGLHKTPWAEKYSAFIFTPPEKTPIPIKTISEQVIFLDLAPSCLYTKIGNVIKQLGLQRINGIGRIYGLLPHDAQRVLRHIAKQYDPNYAKGNIIYGWQFSENDAIFQFTPAIYKYANEYWNKIRASYLVRFITFDDILQRGRWGVVYAMRSYHPKFGTTMTTHIINNIILSIRYIINVTHVAMNSEKRSGIEHEESLDYYDRENDKGSLYETVKNSSISKPDELIENSDFFQKSLSKLSGRKAEIITKRFYSDHTLEEIGDDLCVSRERIRQIQNKALLELHRELKKT